MPDLLDHVHDACYMTPLCTLVAWAVACMLLRRNTDGSLDAQGWLLCPSGFETSTSGNAMVPALDLEAIDAALEAQSNPGTGQPGQLAPASYRTAGDHQCSSLNSTSSPGLMSMGAKLPWPIFKP